jgi:fructose-1,6-bisphosphatase/sedoheptulose 1,7-bisphosphatase-like protein
MRFALPLRLFLSGKFNPMVEPIVFTSDEATPATGDWYNITFSTTTVDAGTILEHCVVEYSGYSQGAIYLNNASPTFQNTQARHSKNKGVYIRGVV